MSEVQPIQRISADKLSALTCLSVGELQKLVARGYFPRAERTGFDFGLALRGCFRFYAETRAAAGQLPVYDSISQAAGRTAIPVAVLKQAKKSGCTAFKTGSRVALGPLLQWIFSQEDDIEDWPGRLRKAQALREELRLSRDQDKTLEKGEVSWAISKVINLFFSILDRLAVTEWPPTLKGLSETEISAKVTADIEKLKTEFKDGLQHLIAEDATTDKISDAEAPSPSGAPNTGAK